MNLYRSLDIGSLINLGPDARFEGSTGASDTSLLFVGYVKCSNFCDISLIFLDKSGIQNVPEIIHSISTNSDYPSGDPIKTLDGGFIICGNGNGGINAFVLKVNSAGKL